MLAGGAPAAMAGGGEEVHADAVHALEDGEDLYLVFGADLGDMTLEEYIDAHAIDAEQDSETEIIQHQDVEQVNVNEQGDAVSISIDGGEATAVQEANQLNANAQTGDASAENEATSAHETQFENVGNVYLVMGDSDDGNQQFNGWGIADDDGEKNEKDIITQSAEAGVTQSQDVGQANVNEQSTAFALAVDGSEATAIQQTDQHNENLQEGAANATNVYVGDGEYAEQDASAWLTQMQAVEQVNVNEQGAAVAIAVGEDSTATAIQVTDQSNLNEQVGSADAANAVASMAGMNVATAGTDASSVVDTKMPGDEKKDKDDEQTATSSVEQEQAVEQINVNLQNTALAIAINDSDASAVQLAHQYNYNAQVGYADALNVYASPGYVYDGAEQASSTTVTVGGDDVDDAPGVSYDYDNSAEQSSDVTQDATAALEQTQFVTQENINEQHSAIAVAENDGSASATQVSMQENENIQFSAVSASNVWIAS